MYRWANLEKDKLKQKIQVICSWLWLQLIHQINHTMHLNISLIRMKFEIQPNVSYVENFDLNSIFFFNKYNFGDWDLKKMIEWKYCQFIQFKLKFWFSFKTPNLFLFFYKTCATLIVSNLKFEKFVFFFFLNLIRIEFMIYGIYI